MDKVLNLYRLPNHDRLVGVISDTTTPPTSFFDGEYYMNHVSNSLYIANGDSSSGGSWSMVIMPVSTNKYYYVIGSNPLQIWSYSNNRFVKYDCLFPSNGRNAEIYDFTYSAQRMGNTHSISATIMYDRCLDDEWSDRVCCIFNGRFFFVDKTPQSSKSNKDARYKHDVTFVSDMVLFENVYFLNIVDPSEQRISVNNWYTFNFFGDIEVFIERLNRSMEYSHLASGGIGYRIVLDTDQYTSDFIESIEEKERLVEVDTTYIKDALDMIYDIWGVPYYINGYTVHIGFSNRPLAESEGVVFPKIEYGHVNELINITKGNTSEGIVNRITGVGGSENVPYFYPNENPNALDIHYSRSGVEVDEGARINNPYKTSHLTASEVPFEEPDGSYFEYGLVDVKRHISQDELINPIYLHNPRTGEFEEYVFKDVYSHVSVYRTPSYYEGNPVVKITKDVFFFIGGSESGNTELSIKEHLERFCSIATSQYETESLFTEIEVSIHSVQNTDREWFDNLQYSYSANNGVAMTYGVGFRDTYHTGFINNGYDGAITVSNNNGTLVPQWPRVWPPYQVIPYWEGDPSITTFDGRFSQNITITRNTDQVVHCEVTFTPRTVRTYEQYIAQIHSEFILKHSSIDLEITQHRNSWTNGEYEVSLYNYGIQALITPQVGDIIYFTSEGKKDYISNIMPPIFRNTGDPWYNALNSTYPKDDEYYTFENEYVYSHAKEHIENFDDIKPTIKGITNSDIPSRRIDMFRDITFDADDDNTRNQNGELNHPYFFVKLARTNSSNGRSFNIFNSAIDDGEMTINMTSGECGGCAFKIMVKRQTNGMSINTIGLFEEDTTIGGVTYLAGTPKRDQNGRVLLDQYYEEQQDTSLNEVWVALHKDEETFKDNILPKKTIMQPSSGDTFVITNIILPSVYVYEAESRLEKALLDYMESNNAEKYSFTVEFSKIFYENNYTLMDKWFNESSRITITYNGNDFDFFAKSYTYKIDSSSHIPTISITFDEKVKVRKNFIARINNTIQSLKPVEFPDGRNYLTTDSDGNLNLNGDIVINGYYSVSKIIDSINSRIELTEKVSTAENSWSKISSRSELANLFKDGTFRYGFNKLYDFEYVGIDYKDVLYQTSVAGEGNELSVNVPPYDDFVRSFGFGQDINIKNDTDYTFVFYSSQKSHESEDLLEIWIRFVLSSQNETSETIERQIKQSSKLDKYAVSFNSRMYNNVKIYFDYYFNVGALSFIISSIMLVEGNFSSFIDDTFTEPTSMAPNKFIPHVDDVNIAIDNKFSAQMLELFVEHNIWDIDHNVNTISYISINENTILSIGATTDKEKLRIPHILKVLNTTNSEVGVTITTSFNLYSIECVSKKFDIVPNGILELSAYIYIDNGEYIISVTEYNGLRRFNS